MYRSTYMLVASLHVAQASPVHATLLLMLPADSTALAIEAMARAGAAAINANPAYYSSVELSIVTTPGRDKAMVSFSDACGVATTQALAGIVGPIYSRDAMLVAPWGAMVGLPMVSYGATSALLSDSTAYTTMMRSVPSDASVIQGVIALLQRYNVTRAVMIAQDDTFGTSGMQSFLSAAANAVPPIAVVLAATFSYRTLKGLDTALNATVAANGRYVVLWASQSLVDSVLLRAAALGLMSPQYSWITSAETTVLAGGAVTAQGTFDGLLQVKPANAQNIPSSPLLTDALVWVSTNYPSAVAVGSLYPVYSFFAYDAVFTLGAGFAQQVQAGGALPSTSTTSCFSPASSNDTASVLMSRLRGLVFRGVTGVVAYSATSTDREDPVISVASLVDSTSGRQSQNVALWQPTLGFSPANFRVTWFGGAAVPPPDRDVLAGRVLRALTVSSPPFVYLPSDTTPTYSGFAIDVVSAIGQKLGFTVEYDEQVNGTYNQLVRAAGERRYDLGVADITVTNARLFYADFCMPYYADHMTMAVRKPVQQALSLWSFMQPFAPTVWVVLGAASVACGLLFFLFENGHSDDLIRLGGGNVWKVALVSVYTSLAVMLMREGAEPSTPAGRLLYLGIVVCSTVVISTYTALVVNSISVAAAVSLITGIRDIASGKLSSSKVGIPSGSANAAYFTNQFSSVYAPISSIESGFQRLQSGELDAIFWDSSSMTFIVNQGYCNLVVLPESVTPSNLAFAMPKDWEHTGEVNEALLSLFESGYIASLNDRYFGISMCTKTGDNIGSQMTLSSLGGIFITLAIFMGSAIVLYGLEHLLRYLRSRGNSTGGILRSPPNLQHADAADVMPHTHVEKRGKRRLLVLDAVASGMPETLPEFEMVSPLQQGGTIIGDDYTSQFRPQNSRTV